MKLTKKLEADILKAYNGCWKAYLEGDLKTHASFLSDQFKFIGTSEGEQFDNKKDWISYCRKTIKQFAGVIQKRQKNIKISGIGDAAMVEENSDLYILIDNKWTYYSKMRISAMMQKEKTGWKYIHQHGSLPDPRANEGEVIAAEQIKKENLQLHEAVKRRTAELENKNRELEIESALERVRAVALTIKQPADMAEICRIISQQLSSLGIKEIRNVQTAIFYDKGTYMNYEYYAKHKKTIITDVEYAGPKVHKDQRKFAETMMSSAGSIYTKTFKGQKLKDWYAYQKTTNQLADKFLLIAHSLNYYWYSLGPVALGISTYYPLVKGEIDLFLRFKNVFDLAYRRYLDIEKAVAQAREAQIEAALEKVRSRSLAMHKSDELREVAGVVFQRLNELGFGMNYGAAIILVFQQGSKDHIQWITDPGQSYPQPFRIPFSDHAFVTDLFDAREKGLPFFARLFPYKEKNEYFRHLFRQEDFRQIPENVKKLILESKNYGYSVAFENNSAILIATTKGKLVSDDEREILTRFAKVFEQSYVRFLDLQKSEAQARESKIQLALERVRARTMAMRKSTELGETSLLLFEQFSKLGETADQVTIGIIDEKEMTAEMSATVHGQQLLQKNVSLREPIVMLKIFEAWKAKQPSVVIDVSGKLLKQYNQSRNRLRGEKIFPEKIKSDDHWIVHVSFFSKGLLSFSSMRPQPAETLQLLERFAGVFELTYTRFLDLKNAEDQARESQIQLGLERVRARTMAMHHSNELADVATVLFQQVKALGVPQWVCGFSIWEPGDKECTWYPGSPDGNILSPCKIPLTEHPVFIEYDESKKRGDELFVYEKEGEFQAGHYRYMMTIPGMRESLQKLLDAGLSFPTFQIDHIANFSHGNLVFITYEHFPEMHDVFKRFAKVFEQTYTRFLDLQKAEAQAREGQIQLALERVRARTMAMQKSEELSETSFVLFQQLKELGEDSDQITIGIFEEVDPVITLYATSHGSQWTRGARIALNKHSVYPQIHSAWKNNLKLFVIDISGKELEALNKFKLESPDYQIWSAEELPKDRWLFYCAYFSNGFVSLGTTIPRSNESIQLLERFAQVFEQTYTRFLDLQKAEAQAREGQIQLALERVRARTMAMQRSDELLEVVSTLYEQLNNLQFDSNACNIIIIDKESNNQRYWVSGFTQKLYPESYNVPYFKHPYIDDQLQSWKEGRNYMVIEYSGKMKQEFDKQFFSQTEFKNIPVEVQKVISALPSARLSTAFFTYGALQIIGPHPLSEENAAILQRFAKVFDQTYTRFLDLQKAEAQAREAQIQLSLERVRARTMAMHNSEDVTSATATMFDEFKKLGLDNFRCGVVNIHRNRTFDVFGTTHLSSGNTMTGFGLFGMDEHPIWQRWFESWINKEEVFVAYIAGQEKEEYFHVINSHSHYLPQQIINFPDSFFQAYYFEEGAVWVYSSKEYNESEKDIMKRFAKGFSLTFRRYQDLKTAEAQAKEVQIQLALERVRARTMAMHKSEELSETAQVVFQQLNELGAVPDRISIGIADEPNGLVNFWSTDQLGSNINYSFKARLDESTVMAKIYKGWKQHLRSLVIDLQGEELNEWIRYAREEMGIQVKDELIKGRRVHQSAYFSHGWILVTTHQPQSTETIQILERFASVFDLTYRRFLDLQKAEGQAREAQIETALERVRAKAMAMHSSEDLVLTISSFFSELQSLRVASLRCGVSLVDKESRVGHFTATAATEQGQSKELSGNLTLAGHPILDAIYDSWKNQKEYHPILKGDEIREYYKVMNREVEFPDFPKELVQFGHYFSFKEGFVFAWTESALKEEELQIFRKFTSVLSLTHRRYKDLKEAEAQAREAKIEAALERVRSRTMAMHRSEEIADIVGKIFGELRQLDLVLNRVLIWIFNNEEKYITWWSANPEAEGNAESYRIDYNDQPVFLTYLQAWQKRIPLHQYTLSGETKIKWEDHLFSNTGLSKLPMAVQNGMRGEGTIFITSTISDYGLMMVGSFEPLSGGNTDIIQRFGRVFQQSYTRYLDVQKAEAQAKEAKIEAALEKVRSRSLAMHRSDELQEVVHTVIERLKELNVELYTTIIIIFSENSKDIQWWLENTEHAQHPRVLLKYAGVPYLQDLFEAKESGKDLFSKCYTGKEKNDLYHYLFEQTDLRNVPEHQKEFLLGNEFATIAIAFAKKTGIHITSYSKKKFSEEETDILKRFAKVFDQSYTRFLDLQKAEAQAREAQIEASLERVRARAMAMHKSEDLKTAVATVFEELDKLNMGLIRCGIAILDKEKPRGDIWITIKSGEGDVLEVSGDEPLDIHPLLKGAYDAWRKSEDYSYILKDEDLLDYYESITQTKFQIPISSTFNRKVQQQYYYNAVFRDGSLFAFLDAPFNNETKSVMKKFANVFDLTYKRFLDLQRAEAQAREATIEAALERVRAKAMAMHQAQDLGETIRSFYQQLDSLQLLPRRCGVGLIDKETRIADLTGMVISEQGETKEVAGQLNLRDNPVLINVYENWLNQKEYQPVLRGNEIKEYYQRIGSQISFQNYPEDAVQYGYFFSFREGAVYAWNENPFTEDELKIYRRFTAVLSLTYKRYLDLKQAEAQAREAMIEAALEKVRSRSLAMHKSDELLEVIMVVSEQLEHLGFKFDNVSFGANNEDYDINFWMAVRDHPRPLQIHVPYLDNPVINRIRDAIKNHSDFFADHLDQAENTQWILHLTEKAGRKFSEEIKSYLTGPHGYDRSTVILKHIFLFIGNYSGSPYTDEENGIFKRFANVFDQSYRRFLDLQKAEAQAREAQIEAGLERVRARTMAMHNSEDVSLATATMLSELEKLDIQNFRGGILNIRDNQTMEVWSINTLDDGSVVRAIGDFDMKIHPFWQQLYKGWKNKDDYANFHMIGKDKEDYIRILDARRDYLPSGLQHLPDSHVQSYFFDEGAVWTFSPQPHGEENKQIMKRFAAVFSLTFRRYQDLKNAEAQAREAKIEASLEKVRSKAMAMHNSQDLADTIGVFYREMQSFSLTPRRCGVGLMDRKDRICELFTWNTTEAGESLELVGRMKMEDHPVLVNIYEHWLTQTEYQPVLRGNEIKEYYEVIRPQIAFPGYANDAVQFGYFFFFREGGVYAWTEKEMSEDDLQIYRRFTTVLSLTYKRYNDLRIAEANAREARIEAAMEKVRARAMAMQKPDELVDVAQLLRKEMGLLGVEELEGSAIFIHNEATGKTECWYAIKDDRREKLGADHITMDLNDTWVGRQMLQFYHSDNKQISIPMLGDHRKEWIHYFSERSSAMAGFYSETVPDRVYHLFKFSNGFMGATSPGEISAESWGLLQRATTVFSLAYTRFSDLQHAEANAKEAVKQAALDRVRAEIASMRTVGDLERITPLIWNELTILGIPFIRCGVFIMDEAQQTIHTFLSNSEGKAIAAFHLPYSTPGNLGLVLKHWHEKKIYVGHWDESSFIELAKILVRQGSIPNEEQYLNSLPRGGFYLHFLPFLQGMLYVGNTSQLGDEDIKLIQHLADAFSTAYARYEDFNRLEAAKLQVEQTLTDLKQAQTQLVQSEKMASLGELTAGIAHEIQNPLNFVNNFSDVSNELLQEMKYELERGNTHDAMALAEDVKQNLEKILHHGKRADDIVKGMLQHSRASSGQKELTDINLLADEYLRLAYHGLRAKDKSFNAKFETDFDSAIEKVNVVPQEIGRVILNLINNAFYAVNEKKKQVAEVVGPGYEPVVTITTRKTNGKISISVADNGIGIPQKSLDKIFQPFFTTKPTSQGTGLGLSLAYDIVTKGHGGELKVETKEGEGSEFIVSLPG